MTVARRFIGRSVITPACVPEGRPKIVGHASKPRGVRLCWVSWNSTTNFCKTSFPEKERPNLNLALFRMIPQ